MTLGEPGVMKRRCDGEVDVWAVVADEGAGSDGEREWLEWNAEVVQVPLDVVLDDVDAFQSGCITVALPTIQKDLRISEANIQWPVSIYALTNGCFLLLAGRSADIVGRRRVFVLGTAWFALWSLIIGFVRTEWLLTVSMGLLGLGASLNTPAGVGILASTFEGPAKQPMASSYPVGFVVGIIVGGVMCQKTSWRAPYWIQAGLSLLFLVLAWFSLSKDALSQDDSVFKRLRRMDWVGAALCTGGLVALTLGFANSQSAPQRWRTPYIPSLLVVGVVLLCAFVVWEIRRENAGQSTILSPHLFKRSPQFSVLLAVVFGSMWSFNAVQYFATLYFQSVLHLTPIRTSLAFVPMTISGVIFCILGGTIAPKLPPAFVIAGSLALSCAAAVIFALIDPATSYWKAAFLVMILVTGPDFSYAVCNVQVCAAVHKNDQSLAGGLFNVASRIGTSMGVALTSTVSTSVINARGGNLVSGYRAAGWVCFGVAVATMLASIVGLRDHRLP
ncbi:major facilitator superfamily MFS-1 [Exidia glandulosa HHB12029]|uniref:Major facilitator superfamily MFS-1 n=1 Tax=Exidia glandulosa HHB12029 TaxID=1314781 RepID=A0A165J881_EXIGL|nr:major facilitator superfamily MFS-1 [Exidia glandulosa HHB12029]